MNWKCFELIIKAKSPIHIGYGARFGIIERTRYYIPGKTIWGAVVARLAQEFNGHFEEFKNFVRENLKFSYFYIEDEGQILFPNYSEDGLKFGNLSLEEFESKYITSYISTAIDKTSRNAEEGSLHEFELIKDRYLANNKIKNTTFIGYLFVNEGSGLRINDNNIFIRVEKDKCFLTDDRDLFDIIKNLQIGGERVYGFGKVEITPKNLEREKVEIFQNVEVDLTEKEPVIKNMEEFMALSHVKINDLKLDYIKGDFEPLVGREWEEKKGAGQRIVGWDKNKEGVVIGLSPGTHFKTKDTLCISEYGIWGKYK